MGCEREYKCVHTRVCVLISGQFEAWPGRGDKNPAIKILHLNPTPLALHKLAITN